MFCVYAIRSANNGLWYVGLTGDFHRRIRAHRNLRPDLYSKGMEVKILARSKNLAKIGRLEIYYIKKLNTVWPDGNNLHAGGLTGKMLRMVREYGASVEIDDLLRCKAPWIQAVKDTIASVKISNNLLAGKKLSYHGKYAQKRKAWARKKAGLPPIKGTEHWLLEPERLPYIISEETRKKIAKVQVMAAHKRWAKRRLLGKTAPHNAGKQWPQSTRDKIAQARILGSIRAGKMPNYTEILDAISRLNARKKTGEQPLLGTEIYDGLQTCLPKPASQAQRQSFRKRMIASVHRWRREYAKKLKKGD